MSVLRTVVPGSLLVDPATSGGPAGTRVFTVRRKRRVARDAVYGLHLHRSEAVLLGVVRGSGYAVVIDARPDTETFGRLAVSLLDDERMLLVPPGCLYGIQSLADGTVVEIRSAARPTRRDRTGVDPDDPDLQLRWLRARPTRNPGPDRSWAGLCSRLGAPSGPRRDRVSIW
ncbi:MULTISPECIES: dTDP-4-dehydrorhamnose 3,5-epimerase family protein [Pseudonocardia]|uniref:dTDP-4-dehydrorhamnose 3,5-epimerase n=1 Tax=Pseudonocardia autotrophica TaxID=2074 RepID=A0A1Y2MPS2_PSEAH|nr:MULTISPECIES: dTDP-4-dehydrorhamnose 3,5-epimerase family protein [Pseudonocardia]OSY37182.1 dTDP-4-dehydrorhamnose 3,5-epimerase [Pseudonocardia autotrophica]TDN74803.1 dTDP-4-dehydrorhamnose 3,5-epimerase [Pseudonocardia autotrophica]